MSLFIVKDALTLDALIGLVSEFTALSRRWGKARRISTALHVPQTVLADLYQCFYCVEFIGADASVLILDDGFETSTIARIL